MTFVRPAGIGAGRVLLATTIAAALFWCTARPAPAAADHAGIDRSRLSRAAAGVGPQDALILAGPDEEILLSENAGALRIPASTLKLVTALAGFEILGEDYRFATDFFLSPDGHLKIKGYGDPMLVSEVVAQIGSVLVQKLPAEKTVGDLVLDDSYFERPVSIPGVSDSFQPYDAPNGALCVNFNTVFFRTAPDGKPASAEPQTPLLPMAVDRIRSAEAAHGRIVLSAEGSESLLYAGQLFAYFLEQAGVRITGRIRPGRVAPADSRLFRHRSPFSLTEVVQRLMTYSNNFTANQILIAAGAARYGAPGTLEKGVRAAKATAEEKLGLEKLQMTEGSGISRQNRISATALLAVLDRFADHRHLLVKKGRVRMKTGTLAGIQTRAGYIEAGAGVYRFVVLINTPGRSADRVVRDLEAALP